jgi:hypothetical protein
MVELGSSEYRLSLDEVRELMSVTIDYFREFLTSAGTDSSSVQKIVTKFRDAGRRSAPWKPASGRVPGRPQDGEDGNRRSRWLFDPEHKFYADETNATLVEVKYFLQTLSMQGAPQVTNEQLRYGFQWLTDHPIEPGAYLDPVQLIPINFQEFVSTRTYVQSGHLIPLDRGGRHVPSNTFLMLARSNQLQGNLTLEELVELMERIVSRHKYRTSVKGT